MSRFPTHGEASTRGRLGIALPGVDFEPGSLLYDSLKVAYDDQVADRAAGWLRRQGESFGVAITEGTGDAWEPKGDPQQATLYDDFVQPLIDPFTSGVKSRVEPYAVGKAKDIVGPIALVGGALVGFLVGRASK